MSPFRMERIEAATRTVVAYFEAFNRHDVEGMLKLLSDDCVFDEPAPSPDGAQLIGKNAIAEYLTNLFAQIPQTHLKVEESIGYGLRCIIRWRCDWVAEAGKQGHLRGVDLYKVQEGLITEKISYVKGAFIT